MCNSCCCCCRCCCAFHKLNTAIVCQPWTVTSAGIGLMRLAGYHTNWTIIAHCLCLCVVVRPTVDQILHVHFNPCVCCMPKGLNAIRPWPVTVKRHCATCCCGCCCGSFGRNFPTGFSTPFVVLFSVFFVLANQLD